MTQNSTKPKVTLFMAMSLNGMVARQNDSEDFLPMYGWEKLVELSSKAGVLIIGRRTYEIVRKNYSNGGFDQLKSIVKIVVSKNANFEHSEDIIVANSIDDALNIASDKGLKSIILSGGPTTNSEFAKRDLIDEIIINIEPVVIGEGLNIFKESDFDLKLTPVSIDKHKAGGYTLVYEVKK